MVRRGFIPKAHLQPRGASGDDSKLSLGVTSKRLGFVDYVGWVGGVVDEPERTRRVNSLTMCAGTGTAGLLGPVWVVDRDL